LTNAQLVAAVAGADAHRGRAFSSVDARTLAELESRTWGFFQCQERRSWCVPTWLDPDAVPRRFWVVAALLVDCYRAGACGLLLSYEEAAALLGCSRRTWARWVAWLEAAGYLRRVPTWHESTSKGRGRDRGRNLYQPGPELLAMAGCGILQGTDPENKRAEGYRSRAARTARERARDARRRRLGEIWTAQESARQRPEAETEAAPLGVAPSKPEGLRGAAPSPRNSREDASSQERKRNTAKRRANFKCSATKAPHPPGPALRTGLGPGEGDGAAPLSPSGLEGATPSGAASVSASPASGEGSGENLNSKPRAQAVELAPRARPVPSATSNARPPEADSRPEAEPSPACPAGESPTPEDRAAVQDLAAAWLAKQREATRREATRRDAADPLAPPPPRPKLRQRDDTWRDWAARVTFEPAAPVEPLPEVVDPYAEQRRQLRKVDQRADEAGRILRDRLLADRQLDEWAAAHGLPSALLKYAEALADDDDDQADD
jgi:hypothetical protein